MEDGLLAVYSGEKDRRCPGSGKRPRVTLGGALGGYAANSYFECPWCGANIQDARGFNATVITPHNVVRILKRRPKEGK